MEGYYSIEANDGGVGGYNSKKIDSVKLKLFRCFRAIRISTIISLLAVTNKLTAPEDEVELILRRAVKLTKSKRFWHRVTIGGLSNDDDGAEDDAY